MLDDASGVVNSFVKDNNSFVVISHSVADVSDKIEKHNELMIKAEIQQNIIKMKERAKSGKSKKGAVNGAIAKYSGTSDINCYNEDWREYVIPYTSSIVVTNNQALFWGCFIVIIVFLIVPLWMWFMNTDDPEDAGATMSMDNNMCPIIEEERWERE
eukprot:gnl/Chilomastix_caulleri/930.p1 GENE.gnl/Chilomastix_caulleri/930~~gnl/Chilomastix_caulleri/930.p1  ORF type:complete len:177 (+),score=44.25 gnl/Chilomastix_caulleri/930:61-531(+)